MREVLTNTGRERSYRHYLFTIHDQTSIIGYLQIKTYNSLRMAAKKISRQFIGKTITISEMKSYLPDLPIEGFFSVAEYKEIMSGKKPDIKEIEPLPIEKIYERFL